MALQVDIELFIDKFVVLDQKTNLCEISAVFEGSQPVFFGHVTSSKRVNNIKCSKYLSSSINQQKLNFDVPIQFQLRKSSILYSYDLNISKIISNAIVLGDSQLLSSRIRLLSSNGVVGGEIQFKANISALQHGFSSPMPHSVVSSSTTPYQKQSQTKKNRISPERQEHTQQRHSPKERTEKSHNRRSSIERSSQEHKKSAKTDRLEKRSSKRENGNELSMIDVAACYGHVENDIQTINKKLNHIIGQNTKISQPNSRLFTNTDVTTVEHYSRPSSSHKSSRKPKDFVPRCAVQTTNRYDKPPQETAIQRKPKPVTKERRKSVTSVTESKEIAQPKIEEKPVIEEKPIVEEKPVEAEVEKPKSDGEPVKEEKIEEKDSMSLSSSSSSSSDDSIFQKVAPIKIEDDDSDVPVVPSSSSSDIEDLSVSTSTTKLTETKDDKSSSKLKLTDSVSSMSSIMDSDMSKTSSKIDSSLIASKDKIITPASEPSKDKEKEKEKEKEDVKQKEKDSDDDDDILSSDSSGEFF